MLLQTCKRTQTTLALHTKLLQNMDYIHAVAAKRYINQSSHHLHIHLTSTTLPYSKSQVFNHISQVNSHINTKQHQKYIASCSTPALSFECLHCDILFGDLQEVITHDSDVLHNKLNVCPHSTSFNCTHRSNCFCSTKAIHTNVRHAVWLPTLNLNGNNT